MDWRSKMSWEREDDDYAAKRRVNNRGSQYMPHIIGAFHSRKMGRVLEYESLGEYLFYCLLELDKQTIRYYVQPVEVPISHFAVGGHTASWMHIPDVLVFRQGVQPILYQIKEASNVPSEKEEYVHSCCIRYADRLNWSYKIVHPKTIPSAIEKNVKLLAGFLKARENYDTLVPQLIYRMKVVQTSSILLLSKGFKPEFDPLQVVPAVYHLVAIGVFAANVNTPINQLTEIRFDSNPTNYSIWEGLE